MEELVIVAQGRSQPYGYYDHEKIDLAVKLLVLLVCTVSLILFAAALVKYLRLKNKKNKSSARFAGLSKVKPPKL